MLVFLYNLLTWFYFTAIRLAALFDEKASLWMKGRNGIFEKMERDFSKRQPEEKVVWMHCASLGEFEQGRTLIEALKAERPEIRMLLTFFSPSGFEIRKNYDRVDWVFYLPADTAGNARRFIEIVRPDLAIFVKYEFWYHFLLALKKREIPTYLIAANFRQEQPFFRWYGHLHRQMLGCFTRIFVQNEVSVSLLAEVTAIPVEVAGDTRVDRVAEMARQPQKLPLIEAFCKNHEVLVCGSTWPEDEAHLFEALSQPAFQHWKIIVAPHDVQAARMQQIERKWKGSALRYSQAGGENSATLETTRMLLIDNVGMLARLYRFGRMAYVGGGFGAGIHNILEPVAYGLPVIFGPKYHKFEEAKFLLKSGGGFTIRDSRELEDVLQKLSNPASYKKAVQQAGTFIRDNQGATEKIMRTIRNSSF